MTEPTVRTVTQRIAAAATAADKVRQASVDAARTIAAERAAQQPPATPPKGT